MASSSSQRKRVKTLERKNMFRGPTPNGWISDESAQSNVLDNWKMRKDVMAIKKKLDMNRFDEEIEGSEEEEKSGGKESSVYESESEMLISAMKRIKQKKRL
ncbi:hypothetical protein LR48_Vigan10g067400 [Vigna angularis]|uniref:Uncharacterized protein n=1 Tax=Phaseolus angularis TaxID=3914 RepID=A0A0L9VIP5_PHAAN|nr:hypothetical protein LR48_Vigan10g067400 [Vigna angularis]